MARGCVKFWLPGCACLATLSLAASAARIRIRMLQQLSSDAHQLAEDSDSEFSSLTGAVANVSLNEETLLGMDAAAAAEAEEEAERQRLQQLAAEEERRADAVWRSLKEVQRKREEEAEEEAWRARQQQVHQQRLRQQNRRTQASSPACSSSGHGGCSQTPVELEAADEERRIDITDNGHYTQQQFVEFYGGLAEWNMAKPAPHQTAQKPTLQPLRDDDEPDATGWTLREQRLLEAALRSHPPRADVPKRERWEAIAAAVPGRNPKECVQRVKALTTAVKKVLPPPLLRLGADLLLAVLEFCGGAELCAVAATCKELTPAAHDDALWLPFADALPSKWAYSRRDREDEPPWHYTLRIREGLFGAWRKLNDHQAGRLPYLLEIGTVERGEVFKPTGGTMDYRVSYGAVCELVQLKAKQQGGLNHLVYKAVAEQLVALSANPRSAIPPDLHMTIREIYKTCYPGFGAGTGSGAYAPGLQAGGSSTKASTSGSMVGKGVATMVKKHDKEEMRKRLDTRHVFMNLISH